jgi:hypothetical protein
MPLETGILTVTDLAPRDTDAVQVPRWAFRLVGGAFLMGFTAFFSTVIVLALWLILLTWGIAGFTSESRKDRKQIHAEIEKLGQQSRQIEKSTKAVEATVVPEAKIP